MSMLFAVWTMVFWTGKVALSVDSHGEIGLRRIRRGLRFIPKYEKEIRIHPRHSEDPQQEYVFIADNQKLRGNVYEIQRDKKEQTDKQKRSRQDRTIVATAALLQSSQRKHYNNKAYGNFLLPREDLFWFEHAEWDSDSIFFSFSTVGDMSDPRPPTMTSTPNTKPPPSAPSNTPTTPSLVVNPIAPPTYPTKAPSTTPSVATPTPTPPNFTSPTTPAATQFPTHAMSPATPSPTIAATMPESLAPSTPSTTTPSTPPTVASPTTLAVTPVPTTAETMPPTTPPPTNDATLPGSLAPSLAPNTAPTSHPSTRPSVASTTASTQFPTNAASIAPTSPPPTNSATFPESLAPSLAPSTPPTTPSSTPPTVMETTTPPLLPFPTNMATISPTNAATVPESLTPSLALIVPPTNPPSTPPTVTSPTTPLVTPFPTNAATISPPTSLPTNAATLPESSTPSLDPSIPLSEPPTREDREILIQSKCGITGLERSRDILVELLKVSKAPDLVNPATSQFAARDWIDNVDDAIVCPDNMDRIHQRYRLALLYFQMGGSQWARCRAADSTLTVVYHSLESRSDEGCPGVPFLDKVNECEWYGLSCGDFYDREEAEWLDQYFAIEELNLQLNNLAGDLFTELYGFPKLTRLLLGGNEKISGRISEDVAELRSLQTFDLGGNDISGPIPNALYRMTELKAIRLLSNRLVGTLSNEIKNLANLTSLEITSNMLNGTVPETGLLQLEQLSTLSMQDNLLEGSLNALCDVRDERREDLETYLGVIQADCDSIACSCCTCS